MKYIFYLFILSTCVFSAVATNKVQPNYEQHFPTDEEITKGAKDTTYNPMVGDDTLPKEKIDYGLGYESKVGKSNVKKTIDETGQIIYTDVNTGETVDTSQKDTTKEYQEAQSVRNLDKQISLEESAKLKAIQKKELESQGYTPKLYENQMLHNLDASSSGMSILGQTILSPKNDLITPKDAKDEAAISHKKSSQLYKDRFSYSQSDNLVKTFRADDNAARLADAFNLVEDMKAQLNSKYSDKGIKCFITRELIPAYFCPMVGREDTMFGGDDKTKLADAQKKCLDNCYDEHKCVEHKILNSKDIILKKDPVQIYPMTSNVIIKSDKINTEMQVGDIQFKIKVTKSDKFKGTDEEFETFLKATKPKFRITITKENPSLNNPNLLVVDKEEISLESSIQLHRTNVSDTMEYLNFLIYKPFITPSINRVQSNDDKKWENIASIEIIDLKGEYKSDKLYFCPFRQIVNNKSECRGENGQAGEIIVLSSGSQVYNICLSGKHKIGPNRRYGAFYSEDTCSKNCVESKDCQPTYKHYTDRSDQMFKVTVGCSDEEDNTACTEEKCIALINDQGLMPTNEWVSQKDERKKQTIANKIQVNGIIRPKFNLSDEFAKDINYDELFQAEMKDAAYANMISQGSYNRIKYRIGEESPRYMSYTSALDSYGRQYIHWNLKPESFKYDNNKTYKLYVVAEVEEMYKPVAGVFFIDGNHVSANGKTEPLQLTDKTYIIKLNPDYYPGNEDLHSKWKVFRKIEFTKYKRTYDVKKCFADGTASDLDNDATHNPDLDTYEYRERGYWNNKIVPENCVVYPQVVWLETPQNNIIKNAFYDNVTDSFNAYSPATQKAEVFKEAKFSSDTPINTYNISHFMQYDLDWTEGLFVRTQVPEKNDMWFKKIYNKPYGGDLRRGWLQNYKIYAFYSEKDLTYSELMNELKPENIIYEKLQPHMYRTKIPLDGEINNNIELRIMGEPSKTTVNVKTTPYLREENKRVFKYMFLYDDANEVDIFGKHIENMK